MPFYSTAYYLLVVIFKPFTSSSTSHINSQVRRSLWLSGRIAQWSTTDPGSIPIGNEFGCPTRAEQVGVCGCECGCVCMKSVWWACFETTRTVSSALSSVSVESSQRGRLKF